MKLPENKKERLQVFVLIGIGVVAVLYAMAQLVVMPFLASKQKLRNSLQSKKAKLEKAQRELNFAPRIKEEFDSVTGELDTIIRTHVLRPILGSYLVGISENLEMLAHSCNIKLDEVQEIGVREPPRTGKKGSVARSFKAYAVQVSARASYDQTATFLRRLEDMNPYLCVSDVRITGQPDNPESHRITLRIEWPIEAESGKEQGSASGRGDKS